MAHPPPDPPLASLDVHNAIAALVHLYRGLLADRAREVELLRVVNLQLSTRLDLAEQTIAKYEASMPDSKEPR